MTILKQKQCAKHWYGFEFAGAPAILVVDNNGHLRHPGVVHRFISRESRDAWVARNPVRNSFQDALQRVAVSRVWAEGNGSLGHNGQTKSHGHADVNKLFVSHEGEVWEKERK